ncbi:CRAL-TRIO domain-containing protein [Cantharellus anzutake]|uniref:CRAL-TRIO domain-containing protein n=1 Tax=Cantharellus anzutake TaxID=1750568 RepID=UPI001903B719|nr:CRAL-TRIO domain-containing protein [Cantharellus anzutake]KAF8313510.1 CRAL-TRIO domain-containing protein [Cantharellus anzutake]
MVETSVPIETQFKLESNPVAFLPEAHQATYDAVEAHFKTPEFCVTSAETPSALTEEEKFWLTKECLLRYLRASKWNQATAIKRLESSLSWRRDYGLYSFLNAELVEPEAVTGKMITFGFDNDGRPAVYMLPSRQNTTESERQLQFCFWLMERCIDIMPPGVETFTYLIDFSDKGTNPSLGTARKMLDILQNHYPERLGRALIINVPFLINAFFKLIMPFVDSNTRVKIKFNPEVIEENIFSKEMVTHAWGGEVNFVWDHSKYWPNLILMAEAHRNANMERWRTLGACVGVSEWEIKGGDETLTTKDDQPSA